MDKIFPINVTAKSLNTLELIELHFLSVNWIKFLDTILLYVKAIDQWFELRSESSRERLILWIFLYYQGLGAERIHDSREGCASFFLYN